MHPTLKEAASRPVNASINQARQLITLWIAWLLVRLFHVDLGLMPLFHGQSPEIRSHVQLGVLPLLYGAMLDYFLLPLIAIVLMVPLAVFGLLINGEAWRWWCQTP